MLCLSRLSLFGVTQSRCMTKVISRNNSLNYTSYSSPFNYSSGVCFWRRQNSL